MFTRTIIIPCDEENHIPHAGVSKLVPKYPEIFSGGEVAGFSPTLAERYIEKQGENRTRAVLSISGISCGGCIRRIESQLMDVPGLHTISVNPVSHRATVVFDHESLVLEKITSQFEAIGYPATPYQPREQEVRIESERRHALLRIMVAAALGMQVMMIATALYFGEAYGMNDVLRTTLEYVAMFLTVPIMVFSARPFFEQAWKNLKHRQAGMDIPVALALTVAFCGSAWATLGHAGQIYYESIAMFVLLLLCARFLELSARRRSLGTVLSMEKSIPDCAIRLDADGQPARVDVRELVADDRIVIQPGDIIPADGSIESGHTAADESVLTGESRSVEKEPGGQVVAGSVNLESPILVRVSAAAPDFAVNRILRLAETAQSGKTRTALMVDRIASYFILAVLALAATAGVSWWISDPSLWLAVVISTLVVACPCALSLATPTAFVAAMGRLSRRGIVPMRGEFLENIRSVDHVVFDKTGTLTTGRPWLKSVDTVQGWDRSQALSIAASLNRHARHPFAEAFRAAIEEDGHAAYREIGDLSARTGSGILGKIGQDRVAIGSARFIGELVGETDRVFSQKPEKGRSLCYLACDGRTVARFELDDTLRDDARAVIGRLKDMGLGPVLLSGDNGDAVDRVAEEAGIDARHGEMSPNEKLQYVRRLRDDGRRVIVVGDGINDAPMVALADVSITMGQASDLTRLHSDAVLLNDRLTGIIEVLELAWKTRRIIRQNLSWALGYNLLAIPCAMFGLVPPWLAAIGMSTSSLIVSGNAMRLGRARRSPRSSVGA